jgi:hypothetical protein
MDNKNPNWGGKRQGSGRPKKWRVVKVLVDCSPKRVNVGEKRRIVAVRNVLRDWEEVVKPYRDRESHRRGAYGLVIQFLDELRESDAKFDNVKKEKSDFLW